MAKTKKPTNIIKLVTSQNKPAPPPAQEEPQPPWHVQVATWALRWRSMDEDVFDLLTPQESRFLARMCIWDEEPTPNQVHWLNKLKAKVATVIAITDPNPAA